MGLIGWIVVGSIAGWIAGRFMKGSGYGLFGDLALGIVGAIVGGWLFEVVAPAAEPSGFIGSLIVATVGAIGLIVVARLVGHRPVRA
ncbi:MAG: GlsB/YeaQ/YmgE family stress response membrane protein [Chloroflexota bacterium]|nr:GlsB/YeaQ/YmgE family stress response membrane protein [Chloroflexota bacterium]